MPAYLSCNTAKQPQQAQGPYEHGKKHYAKGLPRTANPYLQGLANSSTRRPESRPCVTLWFAGWEMERIQTQARHGTGAAA